MWLSMLGLPVASFTTVLLCTQTSLMHSVRWVWVGGGREIHFKTVGRSTTHTLAGKGHFKRTMGEVLHAITFHFEVFMQTSQKQQRERERDSTHMHELTS